MSAEIVVAILSFVGTGLGSTAGVIASSKLTNYRLQQLETKVDKHNCLVERMVAVESSAKSAHHRIDELRGVG